jgi:hypothetical protein
MLDVDAPACRHYHGPLISQLAQAGASKKLLTSMSVAQVSKLLQCVGLLAPDTEGVFNLFSAAAQVRVTLVVTVCSLSYCLLCLPVHLPSGTDAVASALLDASRYH